MKVKANRATPAKRIIIPVSWGLLAMLNGIFCYILLFVWFLTMLARLFKSSVVINNIALIAQHCRFKLKAKSVAQSEQNSSRVGRNRALFSQKQKSVITLSKRQQHYRELLKAT